MICSLVALSCSAENPPSKQAEQALQLRVKQFYTLITQQKYRAAERFVAPESRETYYTQEKPSIKDFTITGVEWGKGGRQADVNLTSLTNVRRATVGQFQVRVPFASHWKLEGGQWMWYLPVVYTRSTPFGPMKVDENAAKQSGLDLEAMVAKGPKPQDLQNAVRVLPASVSVADKNGSVGTATVENSLPGVVHIYTQVISTSGVVAELSKKELGLGDKATLTIRRIRPAPKGSVVYVRVEPTGQTIAVAIN